MAKKKKNKKNKKFIISEGLLVLVGIGLVLAGVFYVGDKVFNSSNKLPKTQLAIKVNSYAEFEDATSEGLINIENPIKNSNNVIVKIVLKSNKEELYESKKLKPGEKVEKIKLSKKLTKGNHDAIAYFYAYDENGKYVGKSGAIISLNIKN